jgi:hypothetical protein
MINVTEQLHSFVKNKVECFACGTRLEDRQKEPRMFVTYSYRKSWQKLLENQTKFSTLVDVSSEMVTL